MKLPVIEGIIRRRILVNFRVEPEVIQKQLPARLRPKLHEGKAIAGICLVRLEQIRPKGLPSLLGINSENAAHRIAVTWEDESGATKEGVFIPRRDTGSRLNALAGGRLFPGEHHFAHFDVVDFNDEISLAMHSSDGLVDLSVRGIVAEILPTTSGFASVEDASRFFEPGSIGFSVTKDSKRLDGISLRTKTWSIAPLNVTAVHSSYFTDAAKFPDGSVHFDCALLMRNIEHEWHSEPDFGI
ncbi:MAG: DUF2071 domain-containing protein [Chthoniobacter sp.]